TYLRLTRGRDLPGLSGHLSAGEDRAVAAQQGREQQHQRRPVGPPCPSRGHHHRYRQQQQDPRGNRQEPRYLGVSPVVADQPIAAFRLILSAPPVAACVASQRRDEQQGVQGPGAVADPPRDALTHEQLSEEHPHHHRAYQSDQYEDDVEPDQGAPYLCRFLLELVPTHRAHGPGVLGDQAVLLGLLGVQALEALQLLGATLATMTCLLVHLTREFVRFSVPVLGTTAHGFSKGG